jgi:hypothetical protein
MRQTGTEEELPPETAAAEAPVPQPETFTMVTSN